MIIGCLGDIPFEITPETLRTVDNMVWSGSGRYAVHQRVGKDALTEFTGLGPDGVTFDIVLSAYLGLNPMEEITKLWKYEREAEAVPLTIGHHAYGRYRWNVVSHKTKAQAYDNEGDMTHATVSVTLQEYLRS